MQPPRRVDRRAEPAAIEGRFQSLNVCLDVWSNPGISEEPKIAETCGATMARPPVAYP